MNEKTKEMAETKIGLSQLERPAPLWYRRLSNALIIFIIPGLVALVQGWGLSDAVANRWLLILAFVPAALKGIGVLLGNGQDYTVKAVAILIAAASVVGCSTVKRSAVSKIQHDSTSVTSAGYHKVTETAELSTDTAHTRPDTAKVTAWLPADWGQVFRQQVQSGALLLNVTTSPTYDSVGRISGRDLQVHASKAPENIVVHATKHTKVTESGSWSQTSTAHQEVVSATKETERRTSWWWLLPSVFAVAVGIILINVFKRISI